MARRKITEEAETNQEQTEEDDQDTADQGSDRTQLTQRMPDDLLDDVDELAETMGVSRNAAINMLVKRGLDGF
ncbi:ribbon-helix-helix CopG family protein [Haloarcula quadrata]|uniref:Ribbon-helix-helix CopG family protein n=1 Tax=Haloarcula quadrata TaxID=182779 RepID=A0A495QQN2_9EURY|nr:ribbon-helix-helix protein, CopG family [Haloarcula quadrata]RKS75799.1 ribbon-helix-helix CopG family protein [Haloarcula quadrata]